MIPFLKTNSIYTTYVHTLYPKACGRIHAQHLTVEIHEEEVDIVEKGMWLCGNGLWGILPTFIYCINFTLTCFIFCIILVTKGIHPESGCLIHALRTGSNQWSVPLQLLLQTSGPSPGKQQKDFYNSLTSASEWKALGTVLGTFLGPRSYFSYCGNKGKGFHLQLGVKRCVLNPGVSAEPGSAERIIDRVPCVRGAHATVRGETQRSGLGLPMSSGTVGRQGFLYRKMSLQFNEEIPEKHLVRIEYMMIVVITSLSFIANSAQKMKFRRQVRKDRFRESYLREVSLSHAHSRSFQDGQGVISPALGAGGGV